MSIKTEALEHWKQNKEWLKQLDWDNWIDYSKEDREYLAPIFSNNCPYCAVYTNGSNCFACPLKNYSGFGCCEEWDLVYINLVENPRSKDIALVTVDGMIKHIEEAEDVG